MKKLKIVISGSRHFIDKGFIYEKIDQFIESQGDITPIIIEGGAKGADAIAKKYSIIRGYKRITKKAKWQDFSPPCLEKDIGFGPYNALAGNKRNTAMAQLGDVLLAFPLGKSKGNYDMIDCMRKFKKTVIIYNYSENGN